MYYLFIFFFLCTSIIGMERVIMTDETAPLIAPKPIRMDDQEKSPSILFDGTRRYYDNESRAKIRNEALKRCLCEAAFFTTCAAFGAAVCGGGLGGGCIYILTCKDVGCCIFTQVQGGLFLDGAFLCCLPASTISLGVTCIACGCMERSELADDPNKVQWVGPLKISPEMCNAASENKKIWVKKEALQHLVDGAHKKSLRDDNGGLLESIRNFLTCYYGSEQQNLKQVQERLEQKSRIALSATVGANVLSRLRQDGMPRDIIKLMFQHINFTKSELNTFSWISEKELFYLLNRLTFQDSYVPICAIYANHILLAQNGWLAFSKSKRYPIKCEAEYFDTNAFPYSAFYGASQAPIIYLPYSLDLAKYYKFEADPAYRKEYSNPTNPHIKELMELRTKFVTQKRDPNLVPIEL